MSVDAPTIAASKKVGMINLGCAKNLVDAEVMLGSILAQGMSITSDPEEADVLVVNTCAFIDSAKEESIDAIFEAHQQRGLQRREGQRLVVSGCMAQRFAKELAKEMPEVDAFLGLDQVAEAGSIIERVFQRETESNHGPLNLVTRHSRYIPDYDTPRYRLTPPHTAYLKIAEGCNHPCSFCVIPQMRGRHRSRTLDSVVQEARHLVKEGVREINLISQDTTYFGMDRWEDKAGPRAQVDRTKGEGICQLIEALDEIEGDFWIRLLYTHPAHWSDDLIEAIGRSRKVARYVDIPLQHIDEGMLHTMRRETDRAHIEQLIDRMRAGIPGLGIRTTFIVGFPGETEAQFESLLEFIDRRRFERLGVFSYSREEGSRAGRLDHQVHHKTKTRRYREAMALQQRIAFEQAEAQIGQMRRVLVDSPLSGRTEHDAPEVDARVVFQSPRPTGEFVNATITGARGYDLLAE